MAALHDMFDVEGKSVIVTGGASGIGRAYAEIMAEHGARVCIFDLDAERLEDVLAELRAKGSDVWGQALDVSDRTRMASSFDKVAEKHGRIGRELITVDVPARSVGANSTTIPNHQARGRASHLASRGAPLPLAR